MLRGYTRQMRNYAASTQEKRLRDAGATAIYSDDLPGAISSLRKGDMLAVAGLHVLGTNRGAIVQQIDRVHAIGSAIHDVLTGWDTGGHKAAALLSNAVAFLSNGNRGPDHLTAQESGRKGAAAWAKRRRRERSRMPLTEAGQFWHDKRLTIAEAMAKINDHPDYPRPWSSATMYRQLGSRGTVPGRRNPKTRVNGIVVPEQKAKRSKRGYVYFMRVDGRGPVKIGFADKVKARIRTHNGSNPGECRVIASMIGTMRTEHDLHAKFYELRVPRKKEWFYYRDPLKAFIAALPVVDETVD